MKASRALEETILTLGTTSVHRFNKLGRKSLANLDGSSHLPSKNRK